MPKWLDKALSVPILKWLVGTIVVLVLLLYVSIRLTWLYKRRLMVERRIRKVEREYAKGIDDLNKAEDVSTVKLDEDRKAKMEELLEEQQKITAAATSGDAALSDVINKAFK